MFSPLSDSSHASFIPDSPSHPLTGQISALLLQSCVTLGNLPNCSVCWLPHQQRADSANTDTSEHIARVQYTITKIVAVTCYWNGPQTYLPFWTGKFHKMIMVDHFQNL